MSSLELKLKFCVAIGTALVETTPVPLGGDFVEQMKIAASIGYDAVELHMPIPDVLNIPAIQKIKKDAKLSIATLGTGSIFGKFGFSLLEKDNLKRKMLVDMVHQFIDCAAILESKVTIGSIKGNCCIGWNREEALEVFGTTLHNLSTYAGERGVTLLIEATNRYENNVLNRGDEVVDIIKKYELDHAQVLLDSFHSNIEEPDLNTCITKIAPYLGHIHVADNTRGYPGSGSFRFEAFTRQLSEIRYDGVVSVECLPKPTGLEAATQAFAFLKKNFIW